MIGRLYEVVVSEREKNCLSQILIIPPMQIALIHGTGDGSPSHFLLVQKPPIRPIFDAIIIEIQASIKCLIHQNTPRTSALGVPRYGFIYARTGGPGIRPPVPLSRQKNRPSAFYSVCLSFSFSFP